ncbi:MAG: AAA family ATPase, partial [Nitrospinaceae bacterium]|nr:AAA family ATPase [Nitrospinaceae bacterium]NIS84989.1 AAA family ATPase [Nitrospinaceae bacterium]NIT81800.1 AAA family ATPase [Nitrospinaceae bacterium]NIU96189.1 AAA family ATPase [Nitrospinaceae bacterium]NIY14982.1 AAA family ATPase [Nitrospinaceae bacterium]
LGLHPEASQKEIDRAYERLIHRFDSPALQKASFPPAALKEKIALLQEAYDTLSNPEKREAHDRALNLGRKRTDPDEESYSLPSLAELKEQNRKQKRNHNVYQDYYGFTEKPFDLTPDPKYLYLSPKHKEVLAHLVYGLQENNGFLKIVGEVGTGKTTICRSFLKELHADFNIAYIFNPGIDELELLQTINTELGLPSDSPSKKKLTDILNTFLLKEREQGHRVVVIIDEAQNLQPEVLEQVRLLSNLETETEKLIQIVLIGQPELDDLLHRDDLRQLRQRITIQWELLPLNLEETRGYIQHRLNVALGKGKVRFTRAAMECIYRYSHGIPRTINVVADRALLIAFTQSTKKITTRVVRRAVKDIGGLRPLTSWRGTVWKKILPAFAGVALLAYGVDRWVLPDWKPPPDPGPDIHSLIEKNPIDLKQPGELVPQKTPQAAATPAPEKPVPTQPAARDRAEEPDRKRRIGPSQALVLSQTDKL